MKKYLLILLSFISQSIYAQQPEAFNALTWTPPYSLSVSYGWNIERFAIPIEFAPEIPYQGVEDLRFAQGWSDINSNEYWTYCFLWFLEGKPAITKESIEKNLTLYYTGLIGRNIERRKIPKEKVFTPGISFRKVETQEGDSQTFQGAINMLDYMAQERITLYGKVHVKSCNDENKSFVFFEISAKPAHHPVWTTMDKINADFKCTK